MKLINQLICCLEKLKKRGKMDLINLIKERRSIRVFTGEKISQENIEQIIEAGIWAPTGCNNQELRFLAIKDNLKLQKMLQFKPFFRGVSHIILIFRDMSIPLSRTLYKKSKSAKNMSFIDTGLAIQNMVLQAKNENISSCIINLTNMHYQKNLKLNLVQKIEKELLKLIGMHRQNKYSLAYFLHKDLKIPNHLEIQCGIVFGFGKNYLNIEKIKHGKNMVKRKNTEEYLCETN